MPSQAPPPPARRRPKPRSKAAASLAAPVAGRPPFRSLRVSRHHGANSLTFPWVGGTRSHDPAAIEHDDAVRDGNELVELGRNQQNRRAAFARRTDMTIDCRDSAHVEAASGLRRQKEDKLRQANLAREHRLLLVATGPRGKRRVGARRPYVESYHQLACRPRQVVSPQKTKRREIREPIEKDIFRYAHFGDAADRVAVLRHNANTSCRDRFGRQVGGLHFAKKDTTATRRHHARQDEC